MTGTSSRHLDGLALAIEEELDKDKIKPLFSGSSSEGASEAGWIVLDYTDVVDFD